MLSTTISTNPLSAVELQQGLVANQFRLCYQPIISLVTSKLLGWEALVRWQHPCRGQLGPSAFIPMAEKTGQISLLGEWILGQACQRLRDWQQKSGNPSLFVSVNLSPLQLHHPRFLWQVDRTLTATGLEPALLKAGVNGNGSHQR
ncbi:MAG: EAL domain-containing protein [Chloroflexaceae bacterium]|nr:EAL domain-containing protein [Chloroflexaceae bacterium]